MKLKDIQQNSYLSYKQYLDEIEELTKTGASELMPYTEAQLKYNRLNFQRIKRLHKTIKLEENLEVALAGLKHHWTWVVITEGWCGDAAQNLTTIADMVNISPKIELKILLRDKNPIIMNHYLTDGTRSIPKLICFDTETENEIFTWGPRPEYAQNLMRNVKVGKIDKTKDEIKEDIHRWYNEDKTITLQQEFLALIKHYD